MTIEAYADTIVPGAKRSADDRVVAGAADGAGAVEAGAVELLEQPGGGLADALDALAFSLNEHAQAYAEECGLTLAADLPPFVALPFADRTALVLRLTTPGHPEHQMWVGLALFSNMAYDSAAHMHTADALRGGHPGLRDLGYFGPRDDGLWGFPRYSYGRPLAPLHPATTATGSPA
ncbi:DUF5987 family protein [Dactylosporangium sp. NPDC000555]|uniref:DUF5987 family protein n=1 Tax=Dactylosporangium sp. NPDC000555 TaxID=3154260 RepID=UPI003329668E